MGNTRSDISYDESIDFTKNEQDFKDQSLAANRITTIQVDYSFNQTDIENFYNHTGSGMNHLLTIVFTFKGFGICEISIKKRGAKGWNSTSKFDKIIDFMASSVNLVYIPAVRTSDVYIDVIKSQIDTQLNDLRKTNDHYNELRTEISEIEDQTISKISSTLLKDLKSWVPKITNVSIKFNRNTYSRAFEHQISLSVNSSGINTLLENKGDGVQSLFALALLAQNNKGITILAIDEPEAHLHPQAIHALKDTILTISHETQVLVSTHSPIFINKLNLSSNLLVESGNVHPANSVSEIREILGIHPSDNLITADKVLFVEGKCDFYFWQNIFQNGTLKQLMLDPDFQIEEMKGNRNLPNLINHMETYIKQFHFLLDRDSESEEVVKRVTNNDGSISFYPGFINQDKVEVEDLIDYNYILEIIGQKYSYFNTSQKIFLEKSQSIVNKSLNWQKKTTIIFKIFGQTFDISSVINDLKLLISETLFRKESVFTYLSTEGRESVIILEKQFQGIFQTNE